MGYLWYNDDGTVQNVGPDWRLMMAAVHTIVNMDCHFSCALQILLENLQRFVDDDDAEVESQICHVKLMNDSLCRILGGVQGVALTVSDPLVASHTSPAELSPKLQLWRASRSRTPVLAPRCPVYTLRGNKLADPAVNICLVLVDLDCLLLGGVCLLPNLVSTR